MSVIVRGRLGECADFGYEKVDDGRWQYPNDLNIRGTDFDQPTRDGSAFAAQAGSCGAMSVPRQQNVIVGKRIRQPSGNRRNP